MPPSAGALALKVFRKALAEAGPSLTALEAEWPAIVGEKLAAVTRPGKLVQGKRGRELTIHTLPAAAILVDHQSETIRQRVSLAAGGDIVRVRIVQGLPAARAAPQPAPQLRALTPEEMAQLERDAALFDDPGLRAAIVALGTTMLTRR